jgi:hypothetical protein
MKQRMLIMSILAMVLVSSAFFSLAAAQDVNTPESTASVDRSPVADDSSSNAADVGLTQDSGETLYAIQDNSTQREQAPETTNQGDVLIATKTNNDNTLAVVAVAIVLALILGAIGIFYHRKKAVKV